MDPEFFARIMGVMAAVQGETPAAYYYNLCSCHPNPLRHPPPGITGEALITAAQGGCFVCLVVKNAISAQLQGPIDPQYLVKYKMKEIYGIRINYMKPGDYGTEQKFEVYPTVGQSVLPAPLHELHPLREVHEFPLSESCLNMIKELLRNCEQSHPRCQQESIDLPLLPTRVVKVGNSTTEAQLHISADERSPYIALSHCWGGEQNVKTERNTLDQRLQGIPWNTLPKTFQDAIMLTRELGIDYIWIDSLCIVQDDIDDWESEGMRMGQIYENAYLTIAASQAPSDREGFLNKRIKHLSTQFELDHPSLQGDTATFHVRTAFRRHRRHDIDAKIRDPLRANLIGPGGQLEPLDYRAWVFQERLISRRLLSFCSKEIEWDCLGCINCECGGRKRNFETEGWDPRNASSRQTFQSILRRKESWIEDLAAAIGPSGITEDLPEEIIQKTFESLTHAYEMWRMTLIPTYSQLRLTKATDRLPALSAVAEKFEDVYGGDKYYTGMWHADLDQAIGWRAGVYGKGSPQPGHLPGEYRAPSWSWASIEGAVDMCFDFEDDFCPIWEVKEASISLAGLNRFADALSGKLKAYGHLLPGKVHVPAVPAGSDEHSIQYACQVGEENVYRLFFPDTPLIQSGDTVNRACYKPGQARESITYPVDLFALFMARPRNNTGFLDRSEVPTVDFAADRWITFLVLSKSDSSAATYHRIGLVNHIRSSSLPESWFQQWPKVEIEMV